MGAIVVKSSIVEEGPKVAVAGEFIGVRGVVVVMEGTLFKKGEIVVAMIVRLKVAADGEYIDV